MTLTEENWHHNDCDYEQCNDSFSNSRSETLQLYIILWLQIFNSNKPYKNKYFIKKTFKMNQKCIKIYF